MCIVCCCARVCACVWALNSLANAGPAKVVPLQFAGVEMFRPVTR